MKDNELEGCLTNELCPVGITLDQVAISLCLPWVMKVIKGGGEYKGNKHETRRISPKRLEHYNS